MVLALAEVSNSGAAFLFVLLALVLGLIFAGLALFLFILWILMLIDALTRKDWQSDDERMMWTIVLVLSLFVGLWGIAAVVYYYVIKRPRVQPEAKIEEAEVVATVPKKKTSKKSLAKKAKAKK